MIADLRELAAPDRGRARRPAPLLGPGLARRRASYLAELLAELGIEPEVDEAGNLWARLEGADPARRGARRRLAPRLGPRRRLARRRARRDRRARRAPGLGRARRAAAAAAGAGRLGRRGGRALRSQPVRQLGVRRHPRPRRRGRVARRRGPADRRGAGRERGRARARGRLRRRAARASAPTSSCTSSRARGWSARACAPPRSAAASGSSGCGFGFAGQASHAGTTPMEMRRDAGLAAAEAALAIERIPAAEGGVATTGELRLEPGIPTAVAGRGDPRRRSAPPRGRGARADARGGARRRRGAAAERRGCELAETPLWRIEPIAFDTGLVFAAPARLRGGRRRGGEPDQRRPPRRRRGRPGAARGDGLRPLEGGDQPRAARRTRPRTTSRSRSRPSPRLPPRPWRAARTCANPERPL